MKLYHGTSAARARQALTDGLKTRKALKTKGNWATTIVSNPNLVYLTIAYAPYFAMAASEEEEEWAIIEVDTDLLDVSDLLPDEDFLEQATRNKPVPAHWGINGADMKKRTRFFRNNLDSFQHHWEDSLKNLGNVAHRGSIPPEAITKITIFSPKKNPMMAGIASDPMISIMNYQLLGKKYRALTRWFAGHEIDPMDIIGFGVPVESLPEGFREDMEKRARVFKEAGHKGLTTIGACDVG